MTDINKVSNDHGFIGTGTPYFYPDATPDECMFIGNVTTASISTGSEEKTRPSRKKENPGAALDTRSLPNPAEVTLTTDTFSPFTWAMAVMGEASKVIVPVVPVTDEAVKAKLSGYAQLKNSNIDASTLVVNKAGTPLPAESYTLNPEMGLLQITDSNQATDGDDLTVNYTTLETKKTVIDAAKVTSFKGKVVIDGMNDVTKQPAKLIISNVSLAVDGSIDWFSDDFNSITMKGTAAVGKNGEAPYTVELIEV